MPISQADIYILPPEGSNELKGGATTLDSHDLELIVLIDGRRPVSAISRLAKTGDPSKIEGVLEDLLRKGFIRVAGPGEGTDGLEYFFATKQKPAEPSEQAASSVAEEAVSGASALRDLGYSVSIARRARAQAKCGELTVLIVED